MVTRKDRYDDAKGGRKANRTLEREKGERLESKRPRGRAAEEVKGREKKSHTIHTPTHRITITEKVKAMPARSSRGCRK